MPSLPCVKANDRARESSDVCVLVIVAKEPLHVVHFNRFSRVEFFQSVQ